MQNYYVLLIIISLAHIFQNDSRIDFDIMRDDDQKIPKEYFRCKVNEKEGNITENIKNNGPSCKIDIRSLGSGKM